MAKNPSLMARSSKVIASILGVAAGFAVGAAFGWYATSPQEPASPHQVITADYIMLFYGAICAFIAALGFFIVGVFQSGKKLPLWRFVTSSLCMAALLLLVFFMLALDPLGRYSANL